MGTLISCYKTSRIAAKTVSTQATECVDPLQPPDCEMEPVTNGQEVQKTVVTELNIGDGVLSNYDCTEHEYQLSIRNNKENKPRRGTHRLKSPPEKREKPSESGSGQCDYVLLPGQVSSADSPLLGPRTEKMDRGEGVTHLNENEGLAVSKSGFATDMIEVKACQESASTHPQANRRMKSTSPERLAANNRRVYQDENSNIVHEGTLMTSSQNQQWHRNYTDARPNQLSCDRQACTHFPSVEYDSRYPWGNTKATSPRRRTGKCDRPFGAQRMLPDRGNEFMYSLEEAFQNNVPINADVLEASAVTGTPSSKLPQPPSANYIVSYQHRVMMREAVGDIAIKDVKQYKTPEASDTDHKLNLQPGRGAGDDSGSKYKDHAETIDEKKAENGQEKDPGKDRAHGDTADPSALIDGAHLSNRGEETDDTDHTLTRPDTDTARGVRTVQPSGTDTADDITAEPEGPLYAIPSRSTLTDSPDASDIGSTKSTISTDIEPSQKMPEENAKQSTKQQPSSVKTEEPVFGGTAKNDPAYDHLDALNQKVLLSNDGKVLTNQADKASTGDLDTTPMDQADRPQHQDQPQEVTRRRSPVGVTMGTTVRTGQPRMSYQAIQEAVSNAILKLSSLPGGEECGQGVQEPDVSISKTEDTAATSAIQDASPEKPFRLPPMQVEDKQSVHFQNVEAQEDQAASSVCVNKSDDTSLTFASSRTPKLGTDGVDIAAHREGESSNDVASSINTDDPTGESGDWEIIPLHRVSAKTDLSGSISPSSLEQYGLLSRSVPPTIAATPIIVKEPPRQKREEADTNILHEDQIINMALGKVQKSAAEPPEQLSRSVPPNVGTTAVFIGEYRQKENDSDSNVLYDDQIISMAMRKVQKYTSELPEQLSRSMPPSAAATSITITEYCQKQENPESDMICEDQMISMAMQKTQKYATEPPEQLSRSMPPNTATTPIIIQECCQKPDDPESSILYEDQVISMAMYRPQKSALHSRRTPRATGEACLEAAPGEEEASSSHDSTTPVSLPGNRRRQGKSPRRQGLTAHEHFQLAEDVYQNWAAIKPPGYSITNTPQSTVTPTVTDDDEDDAHSLSLGDQGGGEGVMKSRCIPTTMDVGDPPETSRE